jgi:uncharacterized protein
MKPRCIALVAAALLVAGTFQHPAWAGTTTATREPLSDYPRVALVIESSGKRLPFKAWVADTPARREQGLMFVRRLGATEGMLFLFPADTSTAFWMKNTLIPLDLLFIRRDGTIARITANAKPMDLSPLPAGEPVLAVFEVAGGTAARLGLRAGDRLVTEALRPAIR